MITDINSLLDSLGQNAAGYDYDANRARTSHANRLKQLAAMGMDRRKMLSDSMAAQGLTHSSVNMKAQTDVARMMDEQRASASQNLADRLADIARRKISEENKFNIQSMLPR